jgi:phosphopantetheinyl transferase (holo-ACP synthase)
MGRQGEELKPGKADSERITLDGTFKSLGFATVRAVANKPRKVRGKWHSIPESSRRNNVWDGSKSPIAFLAKEWAVKEFKSFGTVPANEQPKQETSVVGTSWTVAFANFNEADDSYEWIGKGELQASISGELYGLCKVSGSKTVSHSPWPSTGFFIDRSLTDYRSLIFVPDEERDGAPR